MLADLGVFEGIVLGVHPVVEVGVGELGHGGFVKLQVGEVLAVGAPVDGAAEGEFFLVHPVGGTVDDPVHGTVIGDLRHLTAIEFLDPDVVVHHEGNALAGGVQRGQAVFLGGVDRRKRLFLEVVDEEVALGTAPEKLLGLIGDEHLALVGAELVAVNAAVEAILAGQFGSVQNNVRPLPALQVVAIDLPLLQAGEGLPVFQKIEAAHAVGDEGIIPPHVVERDLGETGEAGDGYEEQRKQKAHT